MATCSISTITRLAPWTRSIAPPMPLTILPGIIQLAMSPAGGDLHGAEDRGVDLAAADHPERGRGVEERRALAQRDGLLAGVDQVRVLLALERVGADAEDAVLGLQHQLDVVGDVVGHQRRQPDAEVDVGPVGQLRGRPRGHLLTRPAAMSASRPRALGGVGRDRSRFSIRLSAACSGVSATTRCTKTPGVWTSLGSSSPGLDQLLDLGDRDPPAHRGQRVEVARGVAVDEVAVPVALPGPHQAEVGDDRLLQHVLRGPRRSRTPGSPSAGEATITLPSASYRHGRPPSATWVPTPVAVKNAGMPDPPARIRSASVPCGVSSTSSSPERYCRANSLFSPTYDETIRRSRFSDSSRPSPQSSTPQLFDTASRSVVPGLQQRVDQHRRDAAQPEPAHRQRRAVRDVGDRLGRRLPPPCPL